VAVETDAIPTFLAEARRIVAETADDAKKLERLTPLMQRLAATPGVLAPEQMRCESSDRATRHTLHETPDHTLALWSVVWPTGYSTLPHNHHTWAIVVGVRGAETNTFWQRVDDGSQPGRAEVRQGGVVTMRQGDVVTMVGSDIHSVANHEPEPSVSIHFYGQNPDTLPREQFDPATGEVRPVKGRVGRL
jgi:predicted metal-dependent enzyme (double-stranded beta helix superfamily)